MAGKLIWVSDELYEECVVAWVESLPDAGTCEWAGDVAGGYESAAEDQMDLVRQIIVRGHLFETFDGTVTSVFHALGMPKD